MNPGSARRASRAASTAASRSERPAENSRALMRLATVLMPSEAVTACTDAATRAWRLRTLRPKRTPEP
jgi:hypothetical protein